MAVERRTNGDESEKACAWDAAQASNVVAVESFMVGCGGGDAGSFVGVGSGKLVAIASRP